MQLKLFPMYVMADTIPVRHTHATDMNSNASNKFLNLRMASSIYDVTSFEVEDSNLTVLDP